MRRALKTVLATATAGLVLATAAPAQADVLVSEPTKEACFQEGIEVGVWYQEYSGGPTWFRIKIINKDTKQVDWRKKGQATTQWKYWTYQTDWIGHWRVVYRTADGKTAFPVLRYGCE